MDSKEERMLGLFFNNPTRELHFSEILKEAGISRSKADRWLKRFIKEGLIRRVKHAGAMPYYVSRNGSPAYMNRKRIFALNQLYASGLLNHLSSLEEAKTVIVFGSFSRSDWYSGSDIDLFIYGKPTGLRLAEFETKLKREIQVFVCQDESELERMGEGLIRNILKGSRIKGELPLAQVSIHA
ncbi:nucleotidyltransferase domain-containing protein [Candidatus Woesearchaeota archaeon]|nr:nucleotidyltransferase domain-containing protein [Candidatus Woesearchaeota archaeon]